jgi:membrane-associated phospholipid phosphatase
METTLERQVRYATYVISPPTVFAGLGYALAWVARPEFWPGLAWGTFYGVATSLLPLLFVVWMRLTGRVGSITMTRRERTVPYFLAVIAALGAWALLVAIDGPLLLRCLTLVNALALGGLGLINLGWKISNHAAAVGAGAMIAGLVFGALTGWLLAPVAVAVCVARVWLRKHTTGQVVAGLALGVAVVLGLARTGCFVP